MAWNRTDHEQARNGNQKSVQPWKKGALAGIVIVALGCAAIFLIKPTTPQTREAPFKNEKKIIAESKTLVTNRAAVVKPQEPVDIRKTRYWELDVSQTNRLPPDLRREWERVNRKRRPIVHIERQNPRYKIFGFRSENMIAGILDAPLGVSAVGRPNYRGLTADFLKSCEVPIVIEEKDDEFAKQLKRDMIQMKIELKERIDGGEKLEDIIEESRAEMRKLASTKAMLLTEINKQKKAGATREELAVCVEAANKILASKGIAPLKVTPILKTKVNRFVNEEIKEQKK